MPVLAGARAALLMISASLLLSMVPVFVKIIPEDSGIPVEEKIFARALVSLLITGVAMMRKGGSFRPRCIRLVVLRSVLGATGMILYFTAVEGLQLSEAVSLNRLSPFFVLLFAVLFLREKLVAWQIIAMILAFLGALVILQPGQVPITRAGVIALLSAVAAGGAYTTLRALGKHDPPLRIVFWFSLALTLIFLPATIAKGVVPAPAEAAALFGIGAAGAAGQLLMTAAYRHAPGGEVAVYGYLSVVYAAVWQPLFFGSRPNSAVLLGTLLVILAGILNYIAARGKPGIRGFLSGVPGFGGTVSSKGID